MPIPRRFNASGRAVGPTVNAGAARLAVGCPRCDALPFTRCFRLTSWVKDSTRPDGGFYTERALTFHPERRAAPKTAGTDRAAIRKELRSLIYKRVPASARVSEHRWMESSRRTDEELTAKLQELRDRTDIHRLY